MNSVIKKFKKYENFYEENKPEVSDWFRSQICGDLYLKVWSKVKVQVLEKISYKLRRM